MTIARSVYVISDLHIGGTYPDPTAQRIERRRGFRMMTHVAELAAFVRQIARLPADPPAELVINGDFIDFLAEERGSGLDVDPAAAPEWTAFRAAPGEALAAFREVARRDRELFKALRELLAAGKALTIVLGNHDIELCLPDVRAALEAELGPGTLRFLDDGRALDLGEVLVDHGNLFDPANVVDHDKLRVVRSVYSRGWYDELDDLFAPPAGSRVVAEVMNPIKVVYGFIDLLKPESEPMFALLLALEPSYRDVLDELASALAGAARSLVPRRGVPWALRNVSDEGSRAPAGVLRDVGGGPAPPSALDELVARVLAEDAAAAATLRAAGVERGGISTEVSGGTWRARWSLFRLLNGDDKGDLAARIPEVQATLRVLEGNQSFVRGSEQARYLDAAAWLAKPGASQKGYKAVVFGHTHHAKALTIPGTQSSYFNTGTWANLMKFPEVFTSKTATSDEVRDALVGFATKLATNDLDAYLVFEPTYVRIDLGADGALIKAELRDYDAKADKL
jgi:UDP-2,3-diacylglucosamine pyrophosphatase LpxH